MEEEARRLQQEEDLREARRLQQEEAERRRIEEEERIWMEEEVRRIQQEEEERRRREDFRDCAVCLEAADMAVMVRVPCNHWYCRDDIQGAFQSALEGRPSRPFQCCGQDVPITLYPNPSADFQRRYVAMELEHTTPNPIYCSNRNCGLFVPPTNYRGPDHAVCDACGYDTCRLCRNPAHRGGVCPQDEGVRQVERLATQEGWRRCPNCAEMVERQYGCNHMTCRCGSEWCYVCGSRTWRTCTHM